MRGVAPGTLPSDLRAPTLTRSRVLKRRLRSAAKASPRAVSTRLSRGELWVYPRIEDRYCSVGRAASAAAGVLACRLGVAGRVGVGVHDRAVCEVVVALHHLVVGGARGLGLLQGLVFGFGVVIVAGRDGHVPWCGCGCTSCAPVCRLAVRRVGLSFVGATWDPRAGRCFSVRPSVCTDALLSDVGGPAEVLVSGSCGVGATCVAAFLVGWTISVGHGIEVVEGREARAGPLRAFLEGGCSSDWRRPHRRPVPGS